MVSLNLAQDEHQMTVKKNIQEEWRIYTRVSSVDMSQNVRVSDVPILRSEQLHIPDIVIIFFFPMGKWTQFAYVTAS